MSRNKREGHFVGFAAGKAVRQRARRFLPPRVRAGIARAYLRRRAMPKPYTVAHLLDQQGAQ